jgi:osmoprotectant transport system substrate-binding protein
METRTMARRQIERRAASTASRIALLAGVVLMLTACGNSGSTGTSSSSLPGAGKPTVILGDKNFDEQFILGELYAQAFRAKGFTVELKSNIGGSELINTTFQSGQINAYPEYLGEVAATDAGFSQPLTSEAQTEQISQQYENSHQATVMMPVTPFFDTDELIVLKDFAQAHNNLNTISQLGSLGPLKLGDYAAEQTRYEGFVGLQQAYGLTNLQFVPLAAGAPIYAALDAKQVQVGDAFSTDAQLLSGNYTPLSDPKNIFGFQHVALIIKTSLLNQLGPAFKDTYKAVTNLLTTEAMQAMNKAVSVDKQSAASVAKAFLTANHLL